MSWKSSARVFETTIVVAQCLVGCCIYLICCGYLQDSVEKEFSRLDLFGLISCHYSQGLSFGRAPCFLRCEFRCSVDVSMPPMSSVTNLDEMRCVRVSLKEALVVVVLPGWAR